MYNPLVPSTYVHEKAKKDQIGQRPKQVKGAKWPKRLPNLAVRKNLRVTEKANPKKVLNIFYNIRLSPLL